MTKYSHSEEVHNLIAPKEIVPEIIRLLNPKSVIDIGCGLGTFLSVFKEHGVTEVLGVDGEWVDKNLLYKYLSPGEFQTHDLEKEIKLDKKYDLVVSLEVAEHLSQDAAEIFVQNLVNSGDVVLFSAAIPLQGGQNHINEQWITYWEAIFQKHDYVIHDILRPIFWDNQNIFFWYKQNMVLFSHKAASLNLEKQEVPMRNIVHYELFDSVARQFDNFKCGKEKKGIYLKLFLKALVGAKNIDFLKKIAYAKKMKQSK